MCNALHHRIATNRYSASLNRRNPMLKCSTPPQEIIMRYWLMKSEPSVMGIDDLLAMPNQTVDWWGVRNYMARNFMRDQMKVGDGVFFYHSSCPEPGIAGLAEVATIAYPDRTQFDPGSKYFDPKATPVRGLRKIKLINLDELRAHPELASMRALQKGNRLSITPIDPAEWKFITKKLVKAAK
jgi:predicted RNA-binding protein with PUA-like domain